MMTGWQIPGILFAFAPVAAAEAPAGPVEGLTGKQLGDFRKGEQLFLTEWAAAPADKGVRDGLGPFYHAASCAACHPGGGRGLSPDAKDPGQGLVFRVGTGEDPMLDDYGMQLSPLAVAGVKPEGTVTITWTQQMGVFADGEAWSLRVPSYASGAWHYGEVPDGVRLSPRLAPALHGMGLLEAVPAESIAALADPDDRNGDGISGRMNMEETWEGYHATKDVTGRFGWKAWMPTLMRQVCGALGEDMGLTNMFQPHDVTPAQSDAIGEYARGGHGALFEAGDREAQWLAAYVRYLAPSAPGKSKDAIAARGSAVFSAIGCAACHVPELKTGNIRGLKALSDRTIHPFTDLLLHDMGPGLADGRPEAKATGSEWRTAPLWGLSVAVNEQGEGLLLHDGRARSLAEAILAHGGEGEKSRDGFNALPSADRAALVRFLRSL